MGKIKTDIQKTEGSDDWDLPGVEKFPAIPLDPRKKKIYKHPKKKSQQPRLLGT